MTEAPRESRRQHLRRLAAGAGAVWAAPVVVSAVAAAQASPPSGTTTTTSTSTSTSSTTTTTTTTPPTPGLTSGWWAQHTIAGSCVGITANYQPYTPNTTATSWSAAPRSCGSLLVRTMYGIGSNGSGTIIAVGDQNFRVRWTGCGSSMTNDSQPFGGSLNTYNDIAANGTNWVAVGNIGRIQRSGDDGVTFAAPTSQPSGSPALQFVAHHNGTWIAGGGTIGLLWRSTDNGANWSSVGPASTSAIFNDVTYSTAQARWLASGTLGEIWESTDDGLSWSLNEDTGADSWAGIDANGSTVIAVAAGLGRLARSTDGGLTWSTSAIGGGTPAFTSVKAGPDAEWMAVGLANEVWWSDDDGATWSAASGLPSLRTWQDVTHCSIAD